jgi:hypothetical protein
MAEAGGAEFVIQGTTLDGRPLRPSGWAERLRCVVGDLWLEQIAPTAYRFLVNLAERARLAEMQRVWDTA